MSGLAAAYYFIKNVGRSASVLILDNHDDFGGHAKRNEFAYNGKLLAINGGTLNIESPIRYNEPPKQLLHDVGIDLDRFQPGERHEPRTLSIARTGQCGTFSTRRPGARTGCGRQPCRRTRRLPPPRCPGEDSADAGRRRRTCCGCTSAQQPDYLPGLSSAEKKDRLAQDELSGLSAQCRQGRQAGAVVLPAFWRREFCVGADATPALFAWEMGQPGFPGLGLEPTPEGVLADLPGGQHGRQKPDGGGVGALSGRQRHRRAAAGALADSRCGAGQDDGRRRGGARQYALLDRAGQPARIRLNSTVVNVGTTAILAAPGKWWSATAAAARLYEVQGQGRA